VAYASHSIAAFLREQEDLDEVLFPVLLRTPEKLVPSNVIRSRASAVDIAVASVDLDPMRSWFDAEAPGRMRHLVPTAVTTGASLGVNALAVRRAARWLPSRLGALAGLPTSGTAPGRSDRA
jgi:hypothetical protein